MTALDERPVDAYATAHAVAHRAACGIDTPNSVLARSTGTLRRLDLDHPRVYAVADMADQGKRRWWALADGAESGRFEQLYRRALQDHPDHATAIDQVATALVHAVVGRVAALLALEGRAWDPGIDNLWIHLDSDVGIDWAGVTDTMLRVTANDREAGSRAVVTMPCDAALVLWTAHRCRTSLLAILDGLSLLGPIDERRFWRLVGESVVGASSFVPMLGGAGQAEGWGRGQALLDAFVSMGHPVRAGGVRRHVSRIERRDLGQAFLYTA